MDSELLTHARNAIGFMPEAEGLALYEAGSTSAGRGPLLEVGTYCGKSAIYLGAAARRGNSVLYTTTNDWLTLKQDISILCRGSVEPLRRPG